MQLKSFLRNSTKRGTIPVSMTLSIGGFGSLLRSFRNFWVASSWSFKLSLYNACTMSGVISSGALVPFASPYINKKKLVIIIKKKKTQSEIWMKIHTPEVSLKNEESKRFCVWAIAVLVVVFEVVYLLLLFSSSSLRHWGPGSWIYFCEHSSVKIMRE